MATLLETYSLFEIVFFIVLLAGAFKTVVLFWDWLVGRLTIYFNKDMQQKSALEARFEEHDEQIRQMLEAYDESHKQQLQELHEKIDILLESDKDDIKAYIIEKHDYFCKQNSIDNYNLDCLEKRYSHYVDEGGNSFIQSLMQDIRKLDKQYRK